MEPSDGQQSMRIDRSRVMDTRKATHSLQGTVVNAEFNS
jgi:hypothetical protein